ncbi:MAG: YhcH/YjgK/YiaL family protein [Kiritimatiellae bacterium]|nr:YhcH/YjgK/YiaL family protein [Kiritimatiellia bacterium]
MKDRLAAESLGGRYAKALGFLRERDFASLAPGRYEIDGEMVFAIVSDNDLKDAGAMQRPEFHRRYADIHAPISGEELFGLPELPESVAKGPFDEEKDIAFFDAECPLAAVKPGEALIVPPLVAHAPCLSRERGRRLRKAIVKVLFQLAVFAFAHFAGCRSAGDYRAEADETEKRYLAAAQLAALGKTEEIEIETPADTLRRRLMLDQNLLANDPASFGIRDIPANLYWRGEERLLEGGEDPSLSVWGGGTNALEIGLVDAVRIAAHNSMEYKTKKDSLFRTALAMDLEDDTFRNIFASTLSSKGNVWYDENERDGFADHAASHVEAAELSVSRKFRNGIRLTGSIMANLAGMLTGDRRTAWGSSADLSISIPLLRGSGTLVNTESLTQAQRSFVYEVRAFEQYKREFICEIESAYLALVLAKRQQQNQDEAFRRVIRSTRRSYRMAEASRMSQSQFDQAHQSELSSKARWIASCQSYESTKDSFKLALGLPPDAKIEPRDSDLAELEEYIGRYAKLELGPYDMGEGGEIALDPPDSVDDGEMKSRTDIAIAIAFTNRLDFLSYRDRIEDAQRKLLVAEDALRAEVTIGTSVSNFADPAEPSMRREGRSHGRVHPREWSANPVLTVDLPIERRAERNAYRNALIAVEAAFRYYQSQEDRLKNTRRSDMRTMNRTKDDLQIQYVAMNLAERRVRNQEILLQAGRADMTVMLEAQDSLVSAKNSLYAAMIAYKNQELALQRDLGLLDVSAGGAWREADLIGLGVLPTANGEETK